MGLMIRGKMEDIKWVFVTGACGGMGRAGVLELRKRGYGVFALDLFEGRDTKEQMISALGAEDGKRVAAGIGSEECCALGSDSEKHKVLFEDDGLIVPIKASVTDEASLIRAKDMIKKKTDRLYAIVHFAGIYMLDSLVEMEDREFSRIFDINVRGAFLVNKTFIGQLQFGSRIIMVTSELAVLDPLPFTGIYAVTKAALDKYAYSLRMELQLLGISVSVLRAGAVDTGMLGASMRALDSFVEDTRLYTCNAKKFKDIVERVEARNIKPETLAKKVLRIAEKKRPRFAYSINRNPLLLLLNFMPKGFQLWVIRKILAEKKRKHTGEGK